MAVYIRYILITLLLLVATIGVLAQDDYLDTRLDSLIRLMNNTEDDELRLIYNDTVSMEHYNVDSTLKYSRMQFDLATQRDNAVMRLRALRYISWALYYSNRYENCVNFARHALNIADSIDNKREAAKCYNDIGNAYSMMKKAAKANEYYLKSLDFFREINDSVNVTNLLRNMAETDLSFQLFSESRKCLAEAIHIDSLRRNYALVGEDYYGLAMVDKCEFERNMYVTPLDSILISAKEYLLKSYDLSTKSENVANLYLVEMELARVMLYRLNHNKFSEQRKTAMLDSCRQMLNSCQRHIDYLGYIYENIELSLVDAHYYITKGMYDKGKHLIDSVAKVTSEDASLYENSELSISRSYLIYYRAIGDYRKAFDYYAKLVDYENKNIKIDDALDASQALVRSEYNMKMKHRELEEERRNHVLLVIIFATLIILLLCVYIVVVALRNNRRWKQVNVELDQKNAELESQKEEMIAQNENLERQQKRIEQQNEFLERTNQLITQANLEMTDSINYASVIQKAVMPSMSLLDDIFGSTLVIYNPLHIVSGDFYWASKIGDYKILAVGDCTGHGVPGAFLSMLGMSILDYVCPQLATKQMNAAMVLDEMRNIFKKSLNQNSEDSVNQDGIDMSLLILDTVNQKMHFAGAFRPMVIVREDNILVERGDRMPIGSHVFDNVPFTDHVVDMCEGDVVYLFTDGMTDQFGYDADLKIRKFTMRRLEDVIKNLAPMPFDVQKNRIENEMKMWRLNSANMVRSMYEQTDDALLVGIRL